MIAPEPPDEELLELARVDEVRSAIPRGTDCQVCGGLTSRPSGWCRKCEEEQGLIDRPISVRAKVKH